MEEIMLSDVTVGSGRIYGYIRSLFDREALHAWYYNGIEWMDKETTGDESRSWKWGYQQIMDVYGCYWEAAMKVETMMRTTDWKLEFRKRLQSDVWKLIVLSLFPGFRHWFHKIRCRKRWESTVNNNKRTECEPSQFGSSREQSSRDKGSSSVFWKCMPTVNLNMFRMCMSIVDCKYSSPSFLGSSLPQIKLGGLSQ